MNCSVSALDAGADDYLTKPFSTVELLARMRAALRHVQPSTSEPVFSAGDIQIDLARRLVTRKGEPVKLTPTEYALLRLLVQHAGRVLTHRQILKEVWGPQYVMRRTICVSTSGNFVRSWRRTRPCRA